MLIINVLCKMHFNGFKGKGLNIIYYYFVFFLFCLYIHNIYMNKDQLHFEKTENYLHYPCCYCC